MPQRMIPFVWVRLLVILGFGVFVTLEGLWILTVIAAALALLSAWQLVSAYRRRAEGTEPIT